MEPSEVLRLKQALALDAANAAGDRESTAWLEPEQWKNYMGKETRKALYGRVSRRGAAGRPAGNGGAAGAESQQERGVLRLPRLPDPAVRQLAPALTAAGLKRPREQRRAGQPKKE